MLSFLKSARTLYSKSERLNYHFKIVPELISRESPSSPPLDNVILPRASNMFMMVGAKSQSP